MSGETESAQKHVVMGRLGAPWGIKGWLKVQSFAEPPENLCEYRRFTLRKGGRLEEVELDTIKPHGKSFVAHIKGCDVREETSRYTGAELLVPTSELPELEEGYYWHELEGLQVVNTAGVVLGRVDHLLATGANDVLVVRGDADSVDREERLLPYVPEQVVLEVDLEQGRITVDWEADY